MIFDQNQFGGVSLSAGSFWKNFQISQQWLKQCGFKPITPNIEYFDSIEAKFGNLTLSDLSNPDEKSQERYNEIEGHTEEATDEEVDEGYLRFIMETRRHQQERAKEKAKKAKKERQRKIIYKDISELDVSYITEIVRGASILETNYEEIYGPTGSLVREIEATILGDFDHFCREKNAKFWPNIPIKIISP